jgi:hypothetical protein
MAMAFSIITGKVPEVDRRGSMSICPGYTGQRDKERQLAKADQTLLAMELVNAAINGSMMHYSSDGSERGSVELIGEMIDYWCFIDDKPKKRLVEMKPIVKENTHFIASAAHKSYRGLALSSGASEELQGLFLRALRSSRSDHFIVAINASDKFLSLVEEDK